MWVLKGTLLGIGIFISTVWLYVIARLGFLVYLTANALKPGGGGVAFEVRGIHIATAFWVIFVLAIAVGLYLAKK